MKYRLLRAVQPFALLPAPLLIWQGRAVRARTPKIPEACGPDHGVIAGARPAIRLAVLGESTAAGVGARHHAESLPGFTAAALAGLTGREVAWRVAARSGATASDVRQEFAPTLRDEPADVVLLVVGVNDLLRLRALRVWERHLAELVAAAGPGPVIVTGMPPVHRFPSLPQPLRAVMGLRALTMDHAIRRTVARAPNAGHLRGSAPDSGDPRYYCEDRFHPSVEGYRLWGRQLAGPLAAAVAGAG